VENKLLVQTNKLLWEHLDLEGIDEIEEAYKNALKIKKYIKEKIK
jgi:hypothetical protein